MNLFGMKRNSLNVLKDSIHAVTSEPLIIEQGLFFTTSGIITISAGGDFYFAGKTGLSTSKNIWLSLPIVVTGKEDVTINVYENTIYSGGSDAPIYNHNRQNNISSSWQEMKTNVVITDIGDKFYDDYIPGATGIGGTASGGITQEKNYYKLAYDTFYCMHIHNGSGDANKIYFSSKWYERPI